MFNLKKYSKPSTTSLIETVCKESKIALTKGQTRLSRAQLLELSMYIIELKKDNLLKQNFLSPKTEGSINE